MSNMHLYVRKLILILWVVVITTDISNGCPVQCSCQSTTNGNEVFCEFPDLHSIPLNLGLPNDTYFLNVYSTGYRSLTKIEDTYFSNLGNLTVLRMTEIGIFVISDNAFRYSRNLQKLRMDNNKLLYLQGKLLVHNDQLINIDFSSNEISTIEVEVFRRLVKLETLLLDNNKISSLDKRLFSNLTNLKILAIHNNLITTIEDNTFINLINLESLSVNSIQVSSFTSGTFNGLQRIKTMNIFDNRKMNRLTAFIFHNLTEVYVIDLKECVIETIEENAFFNITGPLVLSLQNNKIREIHNKAFRDLTGVEIINLDDNFLQTIKSETFVNMPKLNVLTIRRNRIFHIEVNAFGELPELLILSLLSNTLICDCRIRSFRLWVLQQTSTNVDGAVCSEKDGQLIKDISNVEECKETTTEIESSINTSESAETPQPILITKTNNNVDQASNNTSILLEIIACTVSAMAFITIIIYIVIKSRCRDRSSVHKQNGTGKQEEIVGYDLAETPNCDPNDYDLPQEVK